MDKLFSAGREFLENQSQGQGQGTHDDDGLQDAHQEASRLAGSSGSSDLFSRVVGSIGQRKGQIANEDIEEDAFPREVETRIVRGADSATTRILDVARKHEQTYQDDSHGDENTLGAAAAMQALKMFSQGGGDNKGSQGTFLAMAMSEASKLFDNKAAQGKVPEGASKESTVQKAGEMAMKMYFRSQAKQQGGLMGMAAQFMK